MFFVGGFGGLFECYVVLLCSGFGVNGVVWFCVDGIGVCVCWIESEGLVFDVFFGVVGVLLCEVVLFDVVFVVCVVVWGVLVEGGGVDFV